MYTTGTWPLCLFLRSPLNVPARIPVWSKKSCQSSLRGRWARRECWIAPARSFAAWQCLMACAGIPTTIPCVSLVRFFFLLVFCCSGLGVKEAERKQATIKQMPQAALIIA